MRATDQVDVLATEDPVAAFFEAHERGQRIALRTAGTAGAPRTILRTTSSWVDSFSHVSNLLAMDASSHVWIPGPLTSTMNLFAAVHAVWAGATWSPASAHATHAVMTPSELSRSTGDFEGLHVLVAGDRLSRGTYGAAIAAGARVSHYYGAAELSFVAWGEHAEALRAFPGVEVADRQGELWVRSPYVCEGYVEAEHVLRRDEDGWTTVGDRGEVVDGRVVARGRAGGITTGGATVLVADIEHALRPHTSGDLVVVGLPHAELGELVVAVVTQTADVPGLRAASRRSLAAAQRPRRWLQLDSLPLTEHGKVDRQAVVAAVSGGGASS